MLSYKTARSTFPHCPDKATLKRFVSKIERKGGCWYWTAYKNKGGHGRFRLNGKLELAHRVAYLWAHGSVPALLDHQCDNEWCVRPRHLRPSTQRKNILRGVGACAANARKAHCKNGHEFTPENTITITTGKRPRRQCKECTRRQQLAAYYRRTGRPGIKAGRLAQSRQK